MGLIERALSCAALAVGVALPAVAATAPSGPRPMFSRIVRLQPNIVQQPGAAVTPTWTFSYSYAGKSYSEQFVGSDPRLGAASTTITAYIIPVKLTEGSTVEDGSTVISSVMASPLFQNYAFSQGSTALGTTQFTDAFQRANFWGIGGSASGYHVLLSPVIEPTLSLSPGSNGKVINNILGLSSGLAVNQGWLDKQLQSAISALGLPADSLPIFVTTQTYLTQRSTNLNSCCIGGYHSRITGGGPYAQATYIQNSGAFAQNVSAMSHELAEWIDDPFTMNQSACGIYEVGDPLENTANYGDYAYTLNGVTYDLQDEANPVYFGAPASTTSPLSGSTFVGTSIGVCANGS